MATGILAAAVSSESFEAAHRHLLKDSSLQFKFAVPPPQQPPSAWLKALGEALQALAPFLNVIFWGGVALIAAYILYIILREIIARLPGPPKPAAVTTPQSKPKFKPTQAQAQALLEEADRLAREGRYSEAARVLLHRSINDIEDAFPNLVMPSLTAREIGRLEPLSARGRDVFALIARAVERSLFGGRTLDADDFAACRSAYVDFVFGAAQR
ncbi:MAG: hypothetical protein GC190_02800 [Alphaproteobacteria bacterium]|nr:hypothetical protein [Alphaproteobacteria bacterium]